MVSSEAAQETAGKFVEAWGRRLLHFIENKKLDYKLEVPADLPQETSYILSQLEQKIINSTLAQRKTAGNTGVGSTGPARTSGGNAVPTRTGGAVGDSHTSGCTTANATIRGGIRGYATGAHQDTDGPSSKESVTDPKSIKKSLRDYFGRKSDGPRAKEPRGFNYTAPSRVRANTEGTAKGLSVGMSTPRMQKGGSRNGGRYDKSPYLVDLARKSKSAKLRPNAEWKDVTRQDTPSTCATIKSTSSFNKTLSREDGANILAGAHGMVGVSVSAQGVIGVTPTASGAVSGTSGATTPAAVGGNSGVAYYNPYLPHRDFAGSTMHAGNTPKGAGIMVAFPQTPVGLPASSQQARAATRAATRGLQSGGSSSTGAIGSSSIRGGMKTHVNTLASRAGTTSTIRATSTSAAAAVRRTEKNIKVDSARNQSTPTEESIKVDSARNQPTDVGNGGLGKLPMKNDLVLAPFQYPSPTTLSQQQGTMVDDILDRAVADKIVRDMRSPLDSNFSTGNASISKSCGGDKKLASNKSSQKGSQKCSPGYAAGSSFRPSPSTPTSTITGDLRVRTDQNRTNREGPPRAKSAPRSSSKRSRTADKQRKGQPRKETLLRQKQLIEETKAFLQQQGLHLKRAMELVEH